MGYLDERSASDARDSRGGRAMGSDEVPRTPIVDLIAQVNRFTRAGKFGTTIYPLATGNLSPDVARTAIIIQQTRLITAQAQIPDSGTALAIAAATKGLSDPVGYVTGNLAVITGSIAGYADAQGMPAASYAADGGSPAGLSGTMLIGIGVAAVAAFWFFTRSR